jgi:hypothetical protein
MLIQVLQIFFGERTPCKKYPPIDKVIYFKGTILQQSSPLFTSQNRVEIHWKISPFCSIKISMEINRKQNTRWRKKIGAFGGQKRSNWNGAKTHVRRVAPVAAETGLDLGDQIGRIFTYWAIVFFGQLLENIRSSPIFLATFILRKKHLWI